MAEVHNDAFDAFAWKLQLASASCSRPSPFQSAPEPSSSHAKSSKRSSSSVGLDCHDWGRIAMDVSRLFRCIHLWFSSRKRVELILTRNPVAYGIDRFKEFACISAQYNPKLTMRYLAAACVCTLRPASCSFGSGSSLFIRSVCRMPIKKRSQANIFNVWNAQTGSAVMFIVQLKVSPSEACKRSLVFAHEGSVFWT